MPQKIKVRRTQTERSLSMRMRLIEATIESLVECGYTNTTAVEVCRRAGVTRGALLHHFADLTALFEASLERLYDDMGRGVDAAPKSERREAMGARELVDSMWSSVSRSEFKAVDRDLVGGAQRRRGGGATAIGDPAPRRNSQSRTQSRDAATIRRRIPGRQLLPAGAGDHDRTRVGARGDAWR